MSCRLTEEEVDFLSRQGGVGRAWVIVGDRRSNSRFPSGIGLAAGQRVWYVMPCLGPRVESIAKRGIGKQGPLPASGRIERSIQPFAPEK